ncbi:MAG: metallophosphoesterase family protein, partial [Actinomycetota bacterium]
MQLDPASEVITDLLRGAWVIEAARSKIYREWAQHDERFTGAEDRANEAAAIVAQTLAERSRKSDRDLVAPHATWMTDLVGHEPGLAPLGDWFLARLGDWVHAHAGTFIADRARLKELRDSDKLALEWPEQMPAPPPFERVPTVRAKAPGDVEFRFAILGDLHIGSPRGEVMARAAVEELNASGAELVVQLGDITDHGNKDEFARSAKLLESLELPCLTMVGNHDMYSYDEDRLAGREYYASFLGREPDGLIHEHRGMRFAVLDSAENLSSPFAPYNLVTGEFMEDAGGAMVRGALTVPQHEILAELAEPASAPAFVFLHHPPQPFVSFPPIIFGLRDADSGRLHAVC